MEAACNYACDCPRGIASKPIGDDPLSLNYFLFAGLAGPGNTADRYAHWLSCSLRGLLVGSVAAAGRTTLFSSKAACPGIHQFSSVSVMAVPDPPSFVSSVDSRTSHQ